jgi:hypothetical protein
MAPWDKPKEFRRRAAECEELAMITQNADYRRTLLYVASRWRAFAHENECRWAPPELVKQAA